jgi:CRP-like cAMP-binding protein
MQIQPCTCHLAGARAYRGAAAAQSPTENHLLAALPPAEYRQLEPHLEPVELTLGCSIYESGERMCHVFFPTAGIVSLQYALEDGSSAGFALTGNEGMIGISTIMGGNSTSSQAIVVGAGQGYRLSSSALLREFERGGNLQHLLLRYVQALLTQFAQASVCNRHHTLDQQLCRWLLQGLDRMSSNELHVTQELISNMLGVRREGVTEAAGRLQDAGLIRLRRGAITVLDRTGLEQAACECYAVVRRETDRLLSWKPARYSGQVARWVNRAFSTT